MRWTILLALAAVAQAAEPLAGFVPLYDGAAYYPRAAELADGTLLATFDHRIPGGRAIACVRSADGGKTWGGYRRIAEDSGRVDLANAFPLQLPDGTILVACRHHALDRRSYRLQLYASADEGATWQVRSTIVAGTVGLWEPFLFQASRDVLQVYYASEEGIAPDQRIEMKSSRDGGKTWGEPTTVARKRGSRDGMPAVVRMKDGSLLACFEASDTPPFRFVIRTVRSTDDGATWSAERSVAYQPANAARQRWAAGAPCIAAGKDGRVVLSFQTDEDVAYRQGDPQADPGASGYRYERHTALKIVTSADGRSWSKPATLAGSPTASATWPGLCGLRDGTVLVLTTWGGRSWCRVEGPESR